MVMARTDVNLEELRRPIIRGLAMAALAVAWLWISLASTVDESLPSLEPLIPPLLLFAGATLSLLAAMFLPASGQSYLLLAGLIATFLAGYITTGSSAYLYYQSLAVIVASLLLGPEMSIAVAALVTIISLWLEMALLVPPLGLVWAIAAASWLSSRNLYLALGWAMDSQARAWRTAEEVTRRRQQLRRTLDSLRNAHTILERTTRELETARLEADEARKAKSRFVANISHELRTPLNIIVGFAEMICTAPENYGLTNRTVALREDLLKIWRNAEHLLNMIDDVLDLAQIEAARMPVMQEPTDVLSLVRETLVTASILIREANAELRVSLPSRVPLLNVDRTRIRQVLLNLINNAVRFAPGGIIEVGMRHDGDEIIVYVRDSGPGIPPDKLEAIFEEFEQVDTSIRRPYQGVGLGLTISKHFVRLHGGRIWAESEVGRGSTFYFSLPLPERKAPLQPLQARRPWPESPNSTEERRSVVVYSHDSMALRMLTRHLDNLVVFGASSVNEAATLVFQEHPDAALIAGDSSQDLIATLEEGRDLVRRVDPFDVPVMVSAVPTERRAGSILGVREFLVKPVTQKDVAAAVSGTCPKPKQVLIVEDEADMLHLLARMLQREWPDLEVKTASSGEKALDALKQGWRPDVILLDLLMSGMNGVELLEEIRQRLGNVPIVVITARGPAHDLAAASHGEVYILRRSGFLAGETMRLLEMLTKALPPQYAGRAASRLGNQAVAPA